MSVDGQSHAHQVSPARDVGCCNPILLNQKVLSAFAHPSWCFLLLLLRDSHTPQTVQCHVKRLLFIVLTPTSAMQLSCVRGAVGSASLGMPILPCPMQAKTFQSHRPPWRGPPWRAHLQKASRQTQLKAQHPLQVCVTHNTHLLPRVQSS